MLKTTREYGLDQLSASGEAETFGRRHAEYFKALAEDAEGGLAGADWRTWRWGCPVEQRSRGPGLCSRWVWLRCSNGIYRVAAGASKESISVWRAAGDVPRLVDALTYLGSIYRPDARAVPVLLGESIARDNRCH